ncbi:hypothetical protein [Salinisphaera sp. G21_0]|uniref:hypothetical protein n=1 Tax=Salinisphaera sp. G21_0 TaxID=2821094 RepID=UPI001ADAF7DA|nr:hypothetical protein [Salinisphaera sp. G21_0]MBO9483275.1 hypothetical protein [Salinisphaera sp. G21_0]
MQPTRSLATSVPMLQPQAAAANEQMGNSEQIFCKHQVFGRTVSMSKITALSLSVGLTAGLSFVVPGLIISSSLAGICVSLTVGSYAGLAVGGAASEVYRCRQRRHTATEPPSAELSRVISHDPEPTEIPSEVETDNYPATLQNYPGPPPAYTPIESPPPYSP